MVLNPKGCCQRFNSSVNTQGRRCGAVHQAWLLAVFVGLKLDLKDLHVTYPGFCDLLCTDQITHPFSRKPLRELHMLYVCFAWVWTLHLHVIFRGLDVFQVKLQISAAIFLQGSPK